MADPIKLPALPSHPEPMVMKWSPLELAALRARDLEVARVVLEAAAKTCNELHWKWHMGDNSGPKECANAIRELEVKHG